MDPPEFPLFRTQSRSSHRAGMVIKTETAQLRNMRKINIELLLANHKRECPSCARSNNCNLQDIARRLGVNEIRYKQTEKTLPIDDSSDSIVRDPNKCVLCGDCVRVCSEVQSVGAIDFAFRGAKARVAPAFVKLFARLFMPSSLSVMSLSTQMEFASSSKARIFLLFSILV